MNYNIILFHDSVDARCPQGQIELFGSSVEIQFTKKKQQQQQPGSFLTSPKFFKTYLGAVAMNIGLPFLQQWQSKINP